MQRARERVEGAWDASSDEMGMERAGVAMLRGGRWPWLCLSEGEGRAGEGCKKDSRLGT